MRAHRAKADAQIIGIAAIRYYAGLAGKISGSTVDVGESSKQVVVRREPIGVGESRVHQDVSASETRGGQDLRMAFRAHLQPKFRNFCLLTTHNVQLSF